MRKSKNICGCKALGRYGKCSNKGIRMGVALMVALEEEVSRNVKGPTCSFSVELFSFWLPVKVFGPSDV